MMGGKVLGLFSKLRRLTAAPEIVTVRSSSAGASLQEAVVGELPVSARSFTNDIEQIRSEMNGSKDVLTWERPWLANSAELQDRLHLDSGDPRYQTSITVAEACRASKPHELCRALMGAVIHARPQTIVEMGTNVGVSGLYLSAGQSLAGGGKLITLEGSPAKAELARRNFARLQLPGEVAVGDFAETLVPALERAKPVDMAFIDGFHESKATLEYHEAFKRYARPGALLIYDDIDWSEGMAAAWATIAADPDLEFAFTYKGLGFVGLRHS
jgi:predicted O-methyltransferase YrrM